jgi:hypothetical protein
MQSNRLVIPALLAALAVLPSCGSGNNGTTNPVAPPTGSFSNSSLNGTYVFSVSGIDSNGAPYAVVGTFAANGSGGITAGTIDVNDADLSAPVANSPISGSSSYKINVDGRGEVALATSPLGTITLDFVLEDGSHGLLTEFDSNATGSGTLDLQTTATPSGPYAFNLSGTDFSNGSANPFATIGNFTVGSGGAITGLQDLSDAGLPYPNESLSGTVIAGPSSTPATVLASGFGTLTFDVFVIDSSHLKLIEMDAGKNLVGDAYAASSTTMPSGTLAFTLAGSYPGATTVSASGGFIVTDGNGNITTASTFDLNNGGTTVSAEPVGFSGTYTAAGAGRYALALSSFTDGTAYVAYPFSGGVFLLEIDGSGVMSGAAYPQAPTPTLAGAQGYGLNFTGSNLSANEGEGAEVDEIAEFTTNSSGSTITGVVDENYQPGGAPNLGLTLSGTYTTPDSNGRGQVGATAGNNSNSTLNGGFTITYYYVDGTTYPFIETDAGGGQIAAGAFFKQNPTAAAAAAAKSPHPFVVQPPVRAHVRFRKPN